MTLRRRTKKIIFISSGLVLTIALFVWYFFPVLMFNWFWCQSSAIRHDLSITPIMITALKTPPKEWEEIFIGDLTMKLPMSEYSKVKGKETYIYFISASGSLLVSDIAQSKEMLQLINEEKVKYPAVSCQFKAAIFSSTPSDVSFFNSRNKNTTALANQILKAIAIPMGGPGSKLLNINTGTLKALCILSEKGDKGYRAFADVYSRNECVSLSLIFKDYKDKNALEDDLLRVLTGIRMPNHMNDLDQVSKDIDRIVKQYNKT